MITYGPTIENLNLIVDKAKTRRDGVYLFRGVAYRVAAGRFTHLAHNGEVMERAGHFNVTIGKYAGYSEGAKAALKRIR